MTMPKHAGIARLLLARVGLTSMLDDEGRPSDAAFDRIDAGTLSSGERTMVAVAFACLDYFHDKPELGDLLKLDRGNLRAVGLALVALAGEESEAGKRSLAKLWDGPNAPDRKRRS